MTSATLDGYSVFGDAVKVQMIPNPIAVQKNAFFGVNGIISLTGGSRGRRFNIEGCFIGDNFSDCLAMYYNILTYADGLTHVLTDNFGNTWPNVIFEGAIVPDEIGPRCAGGVWSWHYKLSMDGLS